MKPKQLQTIALWTVCLFSFTIFAGWSHALDTAQEPQQNQQQMPQQQQGDNQQHHKPMHPMHKKDMEKGKECYKKVESFELKIDFANNDKLDMNYRKKDDKIYAKVERKTREGKIRLTNEEAQKEIEGFLKATKLSPHLSVAEMVYSTLDTLQTKKEDVKHFELEIKYAKGKKIEIEF